MSPTTITPDLLRNALSFVPANLPRDEWARVGMAIKSEYPDDTGLQLFSDWSAASGGAFDAGAVGSTWRSIKAGGGVGVATLLYQAKQHGFKLPRQGQDSKPVSAAERQRQEDERRQRQQAEDAAIQAAQEAAAGEAAALWASASETGSSAYLVRKGVQGFGVRYGADGWLLVPLRDADGKLWNVQRIAPVKPAKGTDKFLGKGGRKTGLWHVLGDMAGAAVVLVAEGYATAASLHMATGWPVVVAFDAGNLMHVAKALQSQHAGALVVVCGDDDTATQARTGRNPGRDKAEAVARAVGGVVVFPVELPEGGKDFNDMHQACGLEAVQACVQQAIDALHARTGSDGGGAGLPVSGAGGSASSASGGGNGSGRGGKRKGPENDPDDAPGWDDPFTLDDGGVWFHGRDKDGNPARALWLCSALQVEALTRNQEGAGWGYLLTFADPLGVPKQWAMPARMLSGDGGEYRATLLNMGLRIATAPAARNRLTEYIQTRDPGEFASCTDRIGWHGRAFVLPHETIGDDAERIVFQSENQMENTFRIKREAQDWTDRIGRLCAGNSRLVFAVSCAFAGPLLRPGGMESGGFHLRGDSSSGKTTALRLAASVYGGPSYMQRWRTTDNALEAIAAQHCDSLLILDELAQVEGKVAGECAYMLANEQSKARATRNGAARSRLSWRLLFLSAGELGLADHMAEGGKRTRTGQEVRMADIPADAGAGMGAFEHLHGLGDGAAFSSHLAREAGLCHGAVGHAFLQWVTQHADTLAKRVRDAVAVLSYAWVPSGASGQVARVAARFALVGVAGALATEAGLTGWDEGESEDAAKACFDAWLQARGGAGNGEVKAMLRQVRGFLEAHGEGRFTWWHRAMDDHNAKTLMRAGFRRLIDEEGLPIKMQKTGYTPRADKEIYDELTAIDGEQTRIEYFVLPEVFRTELCRGFDHKAVCKVLLQHSCLKPDKGREVDAKPRLPGMGPTWCYRISPAIMELDI
jgi:putative DNA primase/helicase